MRTDLIAIAAAVGLASFAGACDDERHQKMDATTVLFQ